MLRRNISVTNKASDLQNLINVQLTKRLTAMIAAVCLAVVFVAGCADASNGSEREMDIDFNEMSKTIAVSMFIHMVTNPDQYVGQLVRLTGPYAPIFFQGDTIHTIIIMEADICCPDVQFEFMVSDETTMQEGILNIGANLEVVGEVAIFDFNGHQFIYIAADSVKVVS